MSPYRFALYQFLGDCVPPLGAEGEKELTTTTKTMERFFCRMEWNDKRVIDLSIPFFMQRNGTEKIEVLQGRSVAECILPLQVLNSGMVGLATHLNLQYNKPRRANGATCCPSEIVQQRKKARRGRGFFFSCGTMKDPRKPPRKERD